MKRTRSRDAFRGHEDAPLLRIASIVFWYRPVVVSATRLVLPDVEITTTELAQKSRKDLGQCHPKEIEFRTHATNGFRLASSLKAMPQQSNTS